ncbi:MAG: hypothetical protein AAF927_07755 [Bacteroidota bacterium]
MGKTAPTGYWTLMCNPRKWEADRFLRSGLTEDSWRMIPYNRKQDWFEVGQLAVIRVGRDGRTKKELAGRKKMLPGIYALVELIAPPAELGPNKPGFYLPTAKGSDNVVPRIKIRLVENLIDRPLLLEELATYPEIQEDPYLVCSQQASLMPLHPVAMRKLLELIYP